MIELVILGIFMLLSFLLGAYIGQKVVKGEKIEVNPIKTIENHLDDMHDKKKMQQEISKFDIMLENIDNYDGTGIGQKEIPR